MYRSCEAVFALPSLTANAGRSRSSLKTSIPLSWPAARRLCSLCTARIQNLSCSLRKVCTPVRFDMSQTLIDLSSEFEIMSSCLGWNITHDTLFTCPRSVSTSQALLSFMRHSFTCRSSAPETMSGSVWWNDAQLTPRSCPSSKYFTVVSVLPNKSAPILGALLPTAGSSDEPTAFFLSPEMSQTRTVWSSDADTIKSSFGWNCTDMT